MQKKKWKRITDKKYIKSAHPMSLNGMLLCLADIGNVYMKMGLFDQAMKYFEDGLHALEIDTKTEDEMK